MREKITVALAVAAAGLLAYNLYQIFLVLPDEAMQGAIYRIIFFHVPAAITGMIGYFVALTLSILYLSSGSLRWDSLAASVVEVSVIFSVVNIVTGSIWARVIWGIWWTWDYRLTSALVCVLIFSAYLMMRRAIEEPTQRARLVFRALHLRLCGRGHRMEIHRVVPQQSSRTRSQHSHRRRHYRSRDGAHDLHESACFTTAGRRTCSGAHAAGSNRARNRFASPPRKRCIMKRNFMDARNFTFMFYGFLAAWLIVLLYVISLARRGARLKKELDNVRQLVSSSQSSESGRLEDRVS